MRVTAGLTAAAVFLTAQAPLVAQAQERTRASEASNSADVDYSSSNAEWVDHVDDAQAEVSTTPNPTDPSDPNASASASGVSGPHSVPSDATSDPRNKALTSGSEGRSAVTPQAISLPNAEGSVEGMGESFAPVLSSGTATFSVPIAVAAGRAGVQPSVGLSYSSTSGNGPVGIGWGFAAPFIQRQTDRGLPRYRDQSSWYPEEDRFIFGGGQELVPVSNAQAATVDASGGLYADTDELPPGLETWQQYRARVEGGFLRVFRAPGSRSWAVQGKDGTRFDFGLLPSSEGGPSDVDARRSLQTEFANGTGRVFTWHLTRMCDAHGSCVYYRYTEDAGDRLLQDIHYNSPASCSTTGRACTAALSEYGARVAFTYEARQDIVSAYIAGWRVDYTKRLRTIEVSAAGSSVGSRFRVRRYHLAYDAASFHSLLASVQVEGRPDAAGPGGAMVQSAVAEGSNVAGRRLPPMRFTYSTMPTTGPQIPGFGGIDSRVFTVENSPDISLDAARSGIFDVNSDGLPDFIVTDPARFRTAGGQPAVGVYFNGFTGQNAEPAGRAASFSAPVPVPMQAGLSNILNLSSANIVPMDVEGDGRNDLLHLERRDRYGFFVPTRASDTATNDSVRPSQQGWRFTYNRVQLPTGDADPRIDFLRDGTFYKVFDINNDHLIDVVRTTGTTMQTWLNLGWVPNGDGRFGQASWSPSTNRWVLTTQPIETCLLQDGLPVDFSNSELRLADMNGDGLQDVVKINRGRVVYWAGRGNGIFGEGPSTCSQGQGANRGRVMSTPPAELNVELAGVFLEDVNSDGASDIVQVRFREVDVWFNRVGQGFTPRITVTSPFAPDFAPRITFTDLDASATPDLVYGNAYAWQYMDLQGGTRPRLLVNVENGLGAETEIEYGSAGEDYVQDLVDAPSCAVGDNTCDRFTWSHVTGGPDQVIEALSGETNRYRSGGSPVLSTVVRAVETHDHFDQVTTTHVDNVVRTEFAYHDGYYEGIEQEFRGFGAADAKSVGDEAAAGIARYQPTQWTRTFFHQGRRPTDLATDRLAENPYEALKGREWRMETFDDEGRYLATAVSACTVRHLLTGLDGRHVTYAYVSETNQLLYDYADFAPGSGSVTVPWIVEEAVGTSGDIPEDPIQTTSTSVAIRGSAYAQIRSTSESVDNVGHVLQATAYGRVHDERANESADDAITQHVEATLLSADGQWIWRTAEQWTTGSLGSDELGHTTNTYDADTGDLLLSSVDADLTWMTFDFSGDGAAEDITQATNQDLVTSTQYDAWGNALYSCAGADVEVSEADCLRFGAVVYDSAYAQLPVTERTAVDTDTMGSHCDETSSGFCMLETVGTWDRGLGALLTATDPNGATTTVGYDGLGRLTLVQPPDIAGCNSSGLPFQTLSYDLPDVTGVPVSIIYGTTNSACTTSTTVPYVTRSYVDALGRARGTLTRQETNGSWEKTGIVLYGSRGEAFRAYNPVNLGPLNPTFDEALSPPPVPRTTTWTDAFMRPTVSQEQDGSLTIVRRHATFTDMYDPLDLTVGDCEDWAPATVLCTTSDCTSWNPTTTECVAVTDDASGQALFDDTPTTEGVDGHGRAIYSIVRQRKTPNASVEYYLLQTSYRADGAVTSVIRSEVEGDTPSSFNSVVSSRAMLRAFSYDTAGRRVMTLDPDTDNPIDDDWATRGWRYAFNRVGDLVAVRDARGCGQNFYYDRAGRLLGEDYVDCGEALDDGFDYIDSVPAGSVGMDELGDDQSVDVRYYYDHRDGTVPANGKGRLLATFDRSGFFETDYNARGLPISASRNLAVIPEAPTGVPAHLSGDRPAIVSDEDLGTAVTTVDWDTPYETATTYDHAGRVTSMTYPEDPDWADLGNSGSAPEIVGLISYTRRFMPSKIQVSINGGTAIDILRNFIYHPSRQIFSVHYGPSSANSNMKTQTDYDGRLRPKRANTIRTASGTGWSAISTIFDHTYTWDAASNLTRVIRGGSGSNWPAGYKPRQMDISHDALYRVRHVDFGYRTTTGSYTSGDTGTDWRDARDDNGHMDVDPMDRKPAPMIAPRVVSGAPEEPSSRVTDLDYEYDWLANLTRWSDDYDSNRGVFHERSLTSGTSGASPIGNGFDGDNAGFNEDLQWEGLRPSALYFSSNIRTDDAGSATPSTMRGGFVELSYGVGGNVETVTVRGLCHDTATTECYDDTDPLGDYDGRAMHLADNCECDIEHHYQYRWDELNRLVEARRYDRGGEGCWALQVRQRYRYDSGNVRVIKQTLAYETPPETSCGTPEEPDAPDERTALYPYPGDYERRGVVANYDTPDEEHYDAITDATESQYMVGGARIVWNSDATPASPVVFEREHRITYTITDLIQNASAVVDLRTGQIDEMSTFYPNGARETHLLNPATPHQPEPVGFTGKEADEEVGLVYFGERYLMPHLGRWASPDPLAIHSLGGGEVGNSYHYVAGNLLQARDPIGLDENSEIEAAINEYQRGVDEAESEFDPQHPQRSGTDAHARAGATSRHPRLIIEPLVGPDGRIYGYGGPPAISGARTNPAIIARLRQNGQGRWIRQRPFGRGPIIRKGFFRVPDALVYTGDMRNLRSVLAGRTPVTGRVIGLDAKFGRWSSLRGVADMTQRLGSPPIAVRPGGNAVGTIRRLLGMLADDIDLVTRLKMFGLFEFVLEVGEIPEIATRWGRDHQDRLRERYESLNDQVEEINETAGHQTRVRGVQPPGTSTSSAGRESSDPDDEGPRMEGD